KWLFAVNILNWTVHFRWASRRVNIMPTCMRLRVISCDNMGYIPYWAGISVLIVRRMNIFLIAVSLKPVVWRHSCLWYENVKLNSFFWLLGIMSLSSNSVVIVYHCPYGHTATVANFTADSVRASGVQVHMMNVQHIDCDVLDAAD